MDFTRIWVWGGVVTTTREPLSVPDSTRAHNTVPTPPILHVLLMVILRGLFASASLFGSLRLSNASRSVGPSHQGRLADLSLKLSPILPDTGTKSIWAAVKLDRKSTRLNSSHSQIS